MYIKQNLEKLIVEYPNIHKQVIDFILKLDEELPESNPELHDYCGDVLIEWIDYYTLAVYKNKVCLIDKTNNNYKFLNIDEKETLTYIKDIINNIYPNKRTKLS